MINIILLIILTLVICAIINPYKAKYYYERTCIAFGLCPNCMKFSMLRIKDYSVCTICKKR